MWYARSLLGPMASQDASIPHPHLIGYLCQTATWAANTVLGCQTPTTRVVRDSLTFTFPFHNPDQGWKKNPSLSME